MIPAVAVPGAGGGCGVVSGGGGHGAGGGGGGGGAQGGGGGGEAAAGPRQAGPHVLQSLLVPLALAAEVSWDDGNTFYTVTKFRNDNMICLGRMFGVKNIGYTCIL